MSNRADAFSLLIVVFSCIFLVAMMTGVVNVEQFGFAPDTSSMNVSTPAVPAIAINDLFRGR